MYISVPVLHRGLFPDTPFPDAVRVCPGLPAAAGPGYLQVDWPLSPVLAEACLRDAAAFVDSGLSPESIRQLRDAQRQTFRLAREGRDLIRALRPGVSEESDAAPPDHELAQQVLLMAWLQEERLLELESLHRRADAATARLRAVLDGEGDALPDPKTPAVDPDLLPAWRTVLEALALFLPEKAVLVSSDPRLADLRESGMFRSQRAGSGLFEGVLPLWRAVGLSGSRPGRPWLDRSYSFLLYCEDAADHV